MPEQVEKDIFDQAGLAIMREVIDIVRDREWVAHSVLDALDADAVYDLYESFIGPAIDKLEDVLAEDGKFEDEEGDE